MENIFVEFLPPWVETGLQPAFYDKESGTVLQQTARMYARVNMLIRMFNKLSKQTKEEVERFEGVVNDEVERFEGVVNDTVEDYIERFNDLHDYVHDYFDNLDVQEEINNKLDAMASNGDLTPLIKEALNPDVAWTFDTVADMKVSTNLEAGCFAQTLGYHSINDGGGATYKIVAKGSITPNEKNYVAVGTDYIAEICLDDGKINVKQFGAYGDDTNDDTDAIQSSIDYAEENSITEIIIPIGTYKTTAPIMLYDFLKLKGYDRESTIIKKYGHTTDSVYSKDCVLTATYKPGSSLNYPRYVTIEGVLLESGDWSDQPEYGLYFDMSGFMTIRHFASRHTGTCIYLGNMWLSTLKEIATGFGTTGFRVRGGTTLDVNDIYTFMNSEYGYYIQGLSYTQFSNMACDSSPDSIPYYIYYSNLNISGIGCEAENYTTGVSIINSQVSMQDAHICVNHNSASSVVLRVTNSNVIFNNLTVGRENYLDKALGKFLDVVGNGSFISMNGLKVHPAGFDVPNTGNNNNNISINDRYGMFNTTLTGLGFIGNGHPTYEKTTYEKLNIDQFRSQLSSPVNGSVGLDINGNSLAWQFDNRPIGAIIPNGALNKDGAVMLVKTSWDKIVVLPNNVSATTVSGDKLVLTFASLSLGTNIDSMAIKINNKWRIRKVGTTNWTDISTVDYVNNTLTINTTTGFDVDDTVELLPPRDVRECTFIPVQGILTGTTADRPTAPKDGLMYYDTTINKAIWYIGSHWKDATGTNV